MRLLYLALTRPLPANNGNRIRLWLTLRALAALGHRVHLITFTESSEREADSTELVALCQTVQMVPLEEAPRGARSYFRRLRTLGSSLPHAALRYRSPRLRALVARALELYPFDAVLVHTVFAAINLPETDLPIVVNSPDVEHLLFERYAANCRNPLHWLYALWEARRTRRWERRVYARAAVSLATSEIDRARLKALAAGTRFHVLPNAVDVGASHRTEMEQPFRVLFTGALDWLPNRDAVACFISEILPRIAVQVPAVEFVVAGRNPPARFRRRWEQPPRVRFTGAVADMGTEIARAAVAVVPLRIGSGTRLKILEAAAIGRPVVSTRLGAEGLAFAPQSEILVEDEPGRFADAVVNLLSDAALRRKIGEAGRSVVERGYSFPVFCRSLADALATLGPPGAGAMPAQSDNGSRPASELQAARGVTA